MTKVVNTEQSQGSSADTKPVERKARHCATMRGDEDGTEGSEAVSFRGSGDPAATERKIVDKCIKTKHSA